MNYNRSNRGLMLLRSCSLFIWIILLMDIFAFKLASVASGNNQKLPRLCWDDDSRPKCETKGGKVICRGDYKSERVRPQSTKWSSAKVVVLCAWSERYMNPEEVLRLFPLARKLVIRNGNVSELLTDFPWSEKLESLTMRDLRLEALRPTLVSSLINLRHMDMRGNLLTNIDPEVINGHPSLSKVLLSDNPWDCTSDLKWTLRNSTVEKLVNADDMLCSDALYPGKPVQSVMFLIREMETECPDDICSCTMINIVWDTSQTYLVPVIAVNCSRRGLLQLPEKLPLNTTTLLLKENNITDLEPLAKNPIYRNVADIYLDHNSVVSIDLLEGAEWLTQFRVLSLKGNRLRELPTYMLDNAFEKNRNMAKIYLGSNPWKCDCMFTSEFQHLLIKYRSVVKDGSDIKCSDKEDDENALVPVLDISIGSICTAPTNDINPLDIVSAVLALLITLVIGKLVYDYWTFKRTGKLPWLVAKIP